MSRFEKLCTEYRENKRLIEELESMNDELKASILSIMGDNETMTEGASKASYKAVISSRLDSKALQREKPGIYAEYVRETSYKRFTVV